jgi:DNA-binding IscR family transcriptional regulator
MWCELEHIINSYLDSITLQDLIDQRKWSGRGKSGAAKKKCDAAR